MTTPQPGDFALTRIEGWTGRLIRAGLWLNGDGSPVQHALVYVGGGMVVQAMPNGAEYIPLVDASPPVVWSTGKIPMTSEERWDIVTEACHLVGTPYSFADYAYLGLARFGLRPAWLREYIASERSLICSQLVDVCYQRAGVQLFDDGRLPGDVTPGDLWRLLQPQRVTSTDRKLWRLAHGIA